MTLNKRASVWNPERSVNTHDAQTQQPPLCLQRQTPSTPDLVKNYLVFLFSVSP